MTLLLALLIALAVLLLGGGLAFRDAYGPAVYSPVFVLVILILAFWLFGFFR